MGECCLHVFFPELCLCNLLNFEDKNRVECVFCYFVCCGSPRFTHDKIRPVFRKGNHCGQPLYELVNDLFRGVVNPAVPRFFQKGVLASEVISFSKRRLVGLLERKRRTWRRKPELVNWTCVAHELRLFIAWFYVVLALNDCHRSLTRRVKPHSIWRECAISLSSEFQRGHSSKKHDQLSSWSYNCCVVVSGRFKRCLHWTFQLGNYSLGESSSP